MGKAQLHGRARGKPFAIGAFFAFRDCGRKTASQLPAGAQHTGCEAGRAVDRSFRVRWRPNVQVRAHLVRREMKCAFPVNVEAIGALFRASFGKGEENVEQFHLGARQCSPFSRRLQANGRDAALRRPRLRTIGGRRSAPSLPSKRGPFPGRARRCRAVAARSKSMRLDRVSPYQNLALPKSKTPQAAETTWGESCPRNRLHWSETLAVFARANECLHHF